MGLINEYIKYLCYILGIIICIILIILVYKIYELSKTINLVTTGIEGINEKINAINEKVEYLKKSFSTSWYFFIKMAGIIAIIKMINDDYKATPKEKRSLKKSAVRSFARKSSTITNIIKTH